MKKPALQNKQVVILRMAFRARKVIGTFEKRAPGRFVLMSRSAGIIMSLPTTMYHVIVCCKRPIREF